MESGLDKDEMKFTVFKDLNSILLKVDESFKLDSFNLPEFEELTDEEEFNNTTDVNPTKPEIDRTVKSLIGTNGDLFKRTISDSSFTLTDSDSKSILTTTSSSVSGPCESSKSSRMACSDFNSDWDLDSDWKICDEQINLEKDNFGILAFSELTEEHNYQIKLLIFNIIAAELDRLNNIIFTSDDIDRLDFEKEQSVVEGFKSESVRNDEEFLDCITYLISFASNTSLENNTLKLQLEKKDAYIEVIRLENDALKLQVGKKDETIKTLTNAFVISHNDTKPRWESKSPGTDNELRVHEILSKINDQTRNNKHQRLLKPGESALKTTRKSNLDVGNSIELNEALLFQRTMCDPFWKFEFNYVENRALESRSIEPKSELSRIKLKAELLAIKIKDLIAEIIPEFYPNQESGLKLEYSINPKNFPEILVLRVQETEPSNQIFSTSMNSSNYNHNLNNHDTKDRYIFKKIIPIGFKPCSKHVDSEKAEALSEISLRSNFTPETNRTKRIRQSVSKNKKQLKEAAKKLVNSIQGRYISTYCYDIVGDGSYSTAKPTFNWTTEKREESD